jgi:DNA-binding CsgD family transcriptional regulator
MQSYRTPAPRHAYLRLEPHAPSALATLSRHGPLITRALDVLREGLVFFDLDEQPVHANETLRRVLMQQSDAEEIRREICRFTESLSALVRRRPPNSGDLLEEMAVRDFHTSEGSYLLRGSFVRAHHEEGGGLLMVALDSVGAEFLSAELLKTRYGLTSREVLVARLVTRGLSDADIASRLSISRHTARHHTEHLRQKLGVRSRTEVAAHVLRVGRGFVPEGG